jgi:hypothetical protein
MVFLAKSKKMDLVLGQIFNNKGTMIVSFDFITELNMLTLALPEMSF